MGDIRQTVDEFGSGGILQMRVDNIPAPARIYLERKDALLPTTTPWNMEAVGTLALGSSLVYTVPRDPAKPLEFFRFSVDPLQVQVTEEADGYRIVLGRNTSLEDLSAVFAFNGLTVPCLILPYDPADLQPPGTHTPPMLAAGQYFFNNLGQLQVNNMPLLWMPPPAEDDPRYLGRYPPTTFDQGQIDRPHDLPGDGGTGRIEDGWNGDNISARPVSMPIPPEPTGQGMPFDPNTPPSTGGLQDDSAIVTPGTHVRLILKFTSHGIELGEGRTLPNSGNGLGGVPPPLPGDGYILVLRKTGVNAPGNIYHIDSFLDPLTVRSYNPPDRGSHGDTRNTDGQAHLRIPLTSDDPRTALNGVTLQVYKLADGSVLPQPNSLLTAEYFDRNNSAFQKVFETTGNSIIAILIGLREEEKKTPKPVPGASPIGTPTITTVHRGGSSGSKFNLVIIGDGFSSSSTDQQNYRDYVDNVVLDMFRNRDVAPEIMNATNIYRIDTVSQQSGITTVNSMGNVVTAKDTSLEYRYSGSWSRCWMEKGPNSDAITDNLLATLCPQADQVIIILNTTGGGGCARGDSLAVTRGEGWATLAHEVGHMFGGQGDEYQCNQGSAGCGSYSGAELGKTNLTIYTNRNTVKWAEWIPSWRPVPTGSAHVANTSEDVGIFPGAVTSNTKYWTGIYRPSYRGRMNNNSPPHNPVGYYAVRDRARSFQEATFRKNVVGDFNGDGFTDLVRLDGRQLALYLAQDRNLGPDDPVTGNPTRAKNRVLEPLWFGNDVIWNAARTLSWQVRPGDVLIPGDFNGDGKTDLYIFNGTDWSKRYLVLLKSFGDHFEPVARYDNDLPGWQMTAGDQFYVGDLDGDHDADLMIFNGSNWAIPYFILLRSNGSSLAYMRRYDRFLPGWEMGPSEKMIVGDWDGDGRDDIIAFNRYNWSQVHLQLQTCNGNVLSLSDRYYGTIPGIWQMRRNDQLYALDFDHDGTCDAAIFNGLDWSPVYLGLLRGSSGKLAGVRRYDNSTSPLPGWLMQRRDKHWVADVNGDGRDDLVVYNKDNWSTQYLGMLQSRNDYTLAGSWQADWIGSWNLGPTDDFRVADFRGAAHWDDLFVFNDGWFGMLRSYSNQYQLETIYRKWLHNHRYHKNGWW